VPSALAISSLAPVLIVPLLMIGGAFLCYEGIEKILHPLLHSTEEDEEARSELRDALANPAVDLVDHEKTKIRGAIRTDFILSAEIIVISLGTISSAIFSKQVITLTLISVLFTIGVYGLVGAIVKIDDSRTAAAEAAVALPDQWGISQPPPPCSCESSRYLVQLRCFSLGVASLPTAGPRSSPGSIRSPTIFLTIEPFGPLLAATAADNPQRPHWSGGRAGRSRCNQPSQQIGPWVERPATVSSLPPPGAYRLLPASG
jgi:hypothetical protein